MRWSLLYCLCVVASWVLAQNADTTATSAGKVNLSKHNSAIAWQIRTVVIDPGHGGKDPGCRGSSAREKDIALGISQQLAALIRANWPDVDVLLTRDKDVFVPLSERAALANKARADLFISIHCNYIRGSKATHGTETYVLGLHRAEENLEVAKRENSVILLEDNYQEVYGFDPDSPEGHILLTTVQHAFLEQSIRFAQIVETQMVQAQRRSRGVKQAGFVVLRETTMPSVLVETGFLSHAAEERFLLSQKGQRTIAQALARAFALYKAEVEGSTPFALDLPPVHAPITEQHTSKVPTRAIAVAAHSAMPKTPSTTKQPTVPLSASVIVPVEDLSTQSTVAIAPQVHFRVQLAASAQPLSLDAPRWQGTGYTIEVIQEDGYYKYQAGRFSSFKEAFAARRQLQAKGFTDAFVVAYEGTRRISIREAKARKE